MIRQSTNRHAAPVLFIPRSAFRVRQSRSPHRDAVACVRERLGDEARVVADAARLRRILAGDDVPCGHVGAWSIWTTPPTLLTGSMDASAGFGISRNRTRTSVTRLSRGSDEYSGRMCHA